MKKTIKEILPYTFKGTKRGAEEDLKIQQEMGFMVLVEKCRVDSQGVEQSGSRYRMEEA